MSKRSLFYEHPADVFLREMTARIKLPEQEIIAALNKGLSAGMGKHFRVPGGYVPNALTSVHTAACRADPRIVESGLHSDTLELTKFREFVHGGRQNFRLYPGLCHALLNTTVSVSVEHFRMPYRAFTMQIPKSVADRLALQSHTGMCPMSTIWAFRFEDEGEPRISFVWSTQRGGHDLDPARSVMLSIPEAELPHKITEKSLANMVAAQGGVEKYHDGPDALGDGALYRLAFNAINYINTPAADIRERPSEREEMLQAMSNNPKPSQAKRRAAALANASAVGRRDVGSRVKLPNFSQVGGSGKGDWQIKHRFIVRGHWREQACGIGRQDRKLIWIEPFWKGDGKPTLKKRDYEVAES